MASQKEIEARKKQLEKIRKAGGGEAVEKAREILRKRLARDAGEELLKEGKSAIRIPEATEHIKTNEKVGKVKGVTQKFERDPIKVVPGANPHIKTGGLMEGTTGNKFRAKIAALTKASKKGLKAVPLLGPLVGALSAASSGDVSAAVPILGDADNVGPERGSLEAAVEDPTLDREARKRAIEELMRRGQ